MGRKEQKPQFSKNISEFCNLLETAQRDYTWNSDMVLKMDRMTQDYLHNLELGGLHYKERAKIATKIARCRQERRRHKDTVLILEPLVQYLDSERGKELFKMLREVLGKTRKVEKSMEYRVYYPKELREEDMH